MAKTNTKKSAEKVVAKAEPKKVAAKKIEPKKTTKKEVIIEEIIPSEPSLLQLIYGDEKAKPAVEFPNSDLQTQTKNIIKEYAIEVSLLPENILNAVNDLVRDFSYFVDNKNMVNMISVIMDKDLVALNLLKQWAEPKSELLLQLKKENGISDDLPIVNSDSNVVVNSNNAHSGGNVVVNSSNVNAINNLPSNPYALPNNNNVITPENVHHQYQQPQNLAVHNTNPFVPREPVGTYQHTNNSMPLGGENKSVHHEMMTAAAPSIIANNTAQQNHAYTPEPIDMANFLKNYSSSIMDSIKATFQMNHWGYIPLDVLQSILNGSDKSFKYDIILDGKESYIIISDGNETIETDKFSVQ